MYLENVIFSAIYLKYCNCTYYVNLTCILINVSGTKNNDIDVIFVMVIVSLTVRNDLTRLELVVIHVVDEAVLLAARRGARVLPLFIGPVHFRGIHT